MPETKVKPWNTELWVSDIQSLRSVRPYVNGQKISVSTPSHTYRYVAGYTGDVDGVVAVATTTGEVWVSDSFYSESVVYATLFGVRNDGVACGDAVVSAINYIRLSGGTLIMPSGEVNMGQVRPVFGVLPGLKSFNVIGYGCKITFDDLPAPAIDTSTNAFSEEKNLFVFRGTQANYLPPMKWRGITFDYSRQLNKGGTLPSSYGVTHPTPYSKGMRVFVLDYILRPEFTDCTFSNVYGDGFWILRCTQPIIASCQFYDVSGNNLVTRISKNMATDSQGGAIFFHSCWGGVARDNTIINTRVYQVDYPSPDTGVQMKDTPCGYIGIWAEYAMDRAGLPPLVPGAVASSNTMPQFVVIRDNVISGYTMGIKTEERAAASIDANTIRNCYLPIMVSGTYSSVTNNYVEHLGIVARTTPQGGFRVMGGISLAWFNGAPPEFSGPTSHPNVTGNFVYTDGTRPPVVIYANAGVNLTGNKFVVAGSSTLIGFSTIPRTGHVISDNTWLIPESSSAASRGDTVFTATKGYTFARNKILNKGSTSMNIIFNGDTTSTNPESLETINDNIFDGPILIRLSGANITFRDNLYKLQQVKSRVIEVSGFNFNIDNNVFNMPISQSSSAIYVSSAYGRINNNRFQTYGDAAPDTPARSMIELAGTSNGIEVSNNEHDNNIANVPLLNVNANTAGLSAVRNITDSTTAYMIYGSGAMKPPVYIYGNAYGGGVQGGFSSSDPNQLANLGNMRETPYQGMRVDYLRVSSTGHTGAIYTSTGWKAFGPTTG